MAWVHLNSDSRVMGIVMTEAAVDALLQAGDTKLQRTVEQLGNVDIGWYWNATNSAFQIEPLAATYTYYSDADFISHLRERLARHAVIFDNGLKYHWAVNAAAADAKALHVTLTEANTERLDNTIDWGRSWIGYPWRLVKRFEDGESDALTRADLVQMVEYCEGELPNENHIRVWYEIHASGAWRGYYDLRQIWRTSVVSGVGIGIPVDPSTGSGSIDDVIWVEMLKDFYEAALTLGSLKEGGLA